MIIKYLKSKFSIKTFIVYGVSLGGHVAKALASQVDIVILDRLDELIDSFRGGSILLTPHLLDAETDAQAIEHNELHVLKYGVYNLGFLGEDDTQYDRQ